MGVRLVLDVPKLLMLSDVIYPNIYIIYLIIIIFSKGFTKVSLVPGGRNTDTYLLKYEDLSHLEWPIIKKGSKNLKEKHEILKCPKSIFEMFTIIISLQFFGLTSSFFNSFKYFNFLGCSYSSSRY